MSSVIKGDDWKKAKHDIKPDSRRRVSLPGVVKEEGVIYHAYSNSQGQILLDPQVTIPLSEAWLFQNPEALALVKQGLLDAAEGRTSKIDPDSL